MQKNEKAISPEDKSEVLQQGMQQVRRSVQLKFHMLSMSFQKVQLSSNSSHLF